jgi:hypothetical protein
MAKIYYLPGMCPEQIQMGMSPAEGIYEVMRNSHRKAGCMAFFGK